MCIVYVLYMFISGIQHQSQSVSQIEKKNPYSYKRTGKRFAKRDILNAISNGKP